MEREITKLHRIKDLSQAQNRKQEPRHYSSVAMLKSVGYLPRFKLQEDYKKL